MIVLDSQHLSQLQLTETESAKALLARLGALPADQLRVTIISPYEQIRECLGKINATSGNPEVQIRHFEVLHRLMIYYAEWRDRMLPFDQRAADVLRSFSSQLIRRIGPRDARIAAIVLTNSGTLLSANLRDFQQVPGLVVENWLRD